MSTASQTAHFLGPGKLSLAVEELGATVVVQLTGEIDLAVVPWMEAALERVCSNGMERLVLDLQAVSFIDAAGLRAILRANEQGKKQTFEVRVIKPRGPASRVFTLTGLHREINLVDPDVPVDAARSADVTSLLQFPTSKKSA